MMVHLPFNLVCILEIPGKSCPCNRIGSEIPIESMLISEEGTDFI